MTKRHQEFIKADSAAAIGQLTSVKGEFTVVLGPRTASLIEPDQVSDEVIFADFCRMPLAMEGGRRAAVVNLGKKYGRSPKDVYAIVERLKKLGA
jgi:hypothetical protein